jgi:hypothetical protein
MQINIPDDMNYHEINKRLRAGGLKIIVSKGGYELALCTPTLMCSVPDCPARADLYNGTEPLCIQHWKATR